MTTTEKIHKEFKEALNVATFKKEEVKNIPDSFKKLKRMHFTSSSTFMSVKEKAEEKMKVSATNEIVQQVLEIEAKYPKYRIISLSKVIELMKKYQLVFGSVSDYTGPVPEENIKELEEYEATVNKSDVAKYPSVLDFISDYRNHHIDENTYFIVAPEKYFSKNVQSIEGFMLPKEEMNQMLPSNSELTDPIVLNPLKIQGQGLFHIATAWDIEAEDPLVTTKFI